METADNKAIINAICKDLRAKYNKSALTQKELGKELGISQTSLTFLIKEGVNIPKYKVLGLGKIRTKKVFPIVEVAKFLANTEKVY